MAAERLTDTEKSGETFRKEPAHVWAPAAAGMIFGGVPLCLCLPGLPGVLLHREAGAMPTIGEILLFLDFAMIFVAGLYAAFSNSRYQLTIAGDTVTVEEGGPAPLVLHLDRVWYAWESPFLGLVLSFPEQCWYPHLGVLGKQDFERATMLLEGSLTTLGFTLRTVTHRGHQYQILVRDEAGVEAFRSEIATRVGRTEVRAIMVAGLALAVVFLAAAWYRRVPWGAGVTFAAAFAALGVGFRVVFARRLPTLGDLIIASLVAGEGLAGITLGLAVLGQCPWPTAGVVAGVLGGAAILLAVLLALAGQNRNQAGA